VDAARRGGAGAAQQVLDLGAGAEHQPQVAGQQPEGVDELGHVLVRLGVADVEDEALGQLEPAAEARASSSSKGRKAASTPL